MADSGQALSCNSCNATSSMWNMKHPLPFGAPSAHSWRTTGVTQGPLGGLSAKDSNSRPLCCLAEKNSNFQKTKSNIPLSTLLMKLFNIQSPRHQYWVRLERRPQKWGKVWRWCAKDSNSGPTCAAWQYISSVWAVCTCKAFPPQDEPLQIMATDVA